MVPLGLDHGLEEAWVLPVALLPDGPGTARCDGQVSESGDAAALRDSTEGATRQWTSVRPSHATRRLANVRRSPAVG
jgi:hypothetical protein